MCAQRVGRHPGLPLQRFLVLTIGQGIRITCWKAHWSWAKKPLDRIGIGQFAPLLRCVIIAVFNTAKINKPIRPIPCKNTCDIRDATNSPNQLLPPVRLMTLGSGSNGMPIAIPVHEVQNPESALWESSDQSGGLTNGLRATINIRL